MSAAPPRGALFGLLNRSGTAALAVASTAWGLLFAVLLRHRLFASHDAVNNYAHVWYVAGQLWHHHRLPFHMPVIGHGAAYAFPYAFVPWTSAALLWPIFGEWTVTLWLVVGVVGVAGAMFWALPELRRNTWLGAAALLNPALVLGFIFGQLPFLWASAFLFLAVGAWRRQRRPAAAAFAVLAQTGHPAVVLPIMAGVVLVRLVWEPERRALLGWWAASLVPTIPAVWLVVASPVYQESPSGLRVTELMRTLQLRMLLVIVPLLLVAIARRGWRWAGPPAFAALLACNLLMTEPLNTRPAWNNLFRSPDALILGFTGTPEFAPGATYRVLQASGDRVGMYHLIRAGGRLDSEFFPESMLWRNFDDAAAYSAVLAHRHVDFVLDCIDFDRRFGTNEHELLEQLSAATDLPAGSELRTRLVSRTPAYSLYQVLRGGAERIKRDGREKAVGPNRPFATSLNEARLTTEGPRRGAPISPV